MGWMSEVTLNFSPVLTWRAMEVEFGESDRPWFVTQLSKILTRYLGQVSFFVIYYLYLQDRNGS